MRQMYCQFDPVFPGDHCVDFSPIRLSQKALAHQPVHKGQGRMIADQILLPVHIRLAVFLSNGITSFAILVVPIRTAAAVRAELFDLAALRLRDHLAAVQAGDAFFMLGWRRM